MLWDLQQRNLIWALSGSEKFCKEVIIPRRLWEWGGMGGVTLSKGPEAIEKKSCMTGEKE